MEERHLRKTATCSFLCLLVVVALAVLFSQDAKANKEILNTGENTNANPGNLAVNDMIENENITNYINIKSDIGNKYIMIQKPEEMNYSIQIQNSYMDNSIFITIEDLDSAELQENHIKRVNQDVEFIGSSKIGLVSTNNDNENKTTISSGQTYSTGVINTVINEKLYLIPEEIRADGSIMTFGIIPEDRIVDPVGSFLYSNVNYTGITGTLMEFHMDKVYEPFIYQDNKSIYIALKEPKEIYKKVIVLDAGHGGKDPGAYSKSFHAYEKDINLEILLLLKDIIDLNKDIKVYYTRLEDKTVYLNPRVELANRVQADLFISIHCNAADSSLANGLEVLYNEKDTTTELNSKKIAELLFNDLKDITGRINRGLVPASEMVIVGNSKVPVALIEAGFITNGADYAVLSDEGSQKQFARSIYEVILKALK